jgi:hypothetical protein
VKCHVPCCACRIGSHASGEQGHGIRRAAQTLKLIPPTGGEHLADGGGNALADSRHGLQRARIPCLEVGKVHRQCLDARCSAPIGIDAECTRLLLLQKRRRFPKPTPNGRIAWCESRKGGSLHDGDHCNGARLAMRCTT